jgi:hypothetical protein
VTPVTFEKSGTELLELSAIAERRMGKVEAINLFQQPNKLRPTISDRRWK